MYHKDNYPKGDANMGPGKELLRGRALGSDFSGKQVWLWWLLMSTPTRPAEHSRVGPSQPS